MIIVTALIMGSSRLCPDDFPDEYHPDRFGSE
jgi:hypothetical protein